MYKSMVFTILYLQLFILVSSYPSLLGYGTEYVYLQCCVVLNSPTQPGEGRAPPKVHPIPPGRSIFNV